MANKTYTVKKADGFIITGFDHLPNQKLLGFLVLISYICNLAVVDIRFSLTCGTTMITVMLAEIKTVSYYSCISRMFFYNLSELIECLALTLMAIAIRLPLRYNSIMTNLRTFWLIFLTWIFGFAVFAFWTSVIDSLPYCQPVIRYAFCSYSAMVRATCVDPEPYFVISTVLPLCGLFPFILCMYAVQAYSVNKLSNSSRKPMINTCLSHLIVLLSYFAPKGVSVLLTRIGLVLTLTEQNAITIVSSLVPPLINPTVYCFRTKEIRKRLAKVFFFCKK